MLFRHSCLFEVNDIFFRTIENKVPVLTIKNQLNMAKREIEI